MISLWEYLCAVNNTDTLTMEPIDYDHETILNRLNTGVLKLGYYPENNIEISGPKYYLYKSQADGSTTLKVVRTFAPNGDTTFTYNTFSPASSCDDRLSGEGEDVMLSKTYEMFSNDSEVKFRLVKLAQKYGIDLKSGLNH